MQLVNIFTICLAKFLSKLSSVLGKGDGTALPGLVMEKINPNILRYFSKQIPNIILITGTNGKTTTQLTINSILSCCNKKVISNKSGSNMLRGLLSLFVDKCSLTGKLDYEYAVFEIEEATMPRIVGQINPKHIVVTNLYRDQLDAYGEIERTKNMIKKAITIAKDATIYINADDPQLNGIVEKGRKVIRVGIDKEYLFNFDYEGKANKQENIDFLGEDIKIQDDLGSTFVVNGDKYVFNSPGIYNVYNAIFAIAVSINLQIPIDNIQEGIMETNIAFGRGELLKKGNNKFRLFLAKNPAGMNLVIGLLKNVTRPNLIILLNDAIADGRDTSWIWDAKFEDIKDANPESIIVSGNRGLDVAIRLKYAGINMDKVQYIDGIDKLVKKLEQESDGKFYYVIHTYTAMLKFRKAILGRAIDK